MANLKEIMTRDGQKPNDKAKFIMNFALFMTHWTEVPDGSTIINLHELSKQFLEVSGDARTEQKAAV